MTRTNASSGLIKRSDQEKDYNEEMDELLSKSIFNNIENLANFPMYAPRQSIASFLSRYELFKKSLNVHGSIIECGVGHGGGLMAFAQLSAIFEPVNHTKKIVGFDTFEGFPNLSNLDSKDRDPQARVGGLQYDSYQELQECVSLYDKNRFLGHLPKVELVKGDASETIPKYLEDNPHLVVGLLYLDFDLYEPTVAALRYFLPRMPKGAVIAFDEINHPDWPGETLAVLHEIGISKLRIEHWTFDSTRSYAVLE